MYAGWVSLGGVEIINTSKTLQYASRLGVPVWCQDDCPNLNVVLGDESYATGFNTPWSDDPTAPEGFLGLHGLSVTGMQDGVLRNIVTDLPGDGAAIGIGRRNRREMLFQVLALATSDRALNYGIAWLNSTLRGATCDSTGNCVGSTMCFYDECPDCTDQTPDECNQAHLRNLFNVGVLEPPTVVSRGKFPGTCQSSSEPAAYAVLEFTLVAGIPYIYSQPQLIGETDAWILNQGWFPDSHGECTPPQECFLDFECPTPSVPPVVPVPVNECIERLPGLYDTQWMSLDGDDISDWFEKVPYVTAYAGSDIMRCVAIRFAINPLNNTCSNATMDNCSVCVTIYVPFIPAGGTLIIDGRLERAFIVCPAVTGGSSNSGSTFDETIVYGEEGHIYDWPKIECGEDMCVQVQAHTDFRAPDALVTVSLVERRDTV